MGDKFVVRFIRLDNKPDEEYFYNRETDAQKHLDAFVDDDSCLYKGIVLLDTSSDTVLRILTFENGVFKEDIRDWDIAQLRSDCRTPIEESLLLRQTTLTKA